MSLRVIWCLGMYASASTWLFNVVRQMHASSESGPVQGHFVSDTQNLAGLDAGITHIVKSHEIPDEKTILGLAGQAGKILVTVRDPRDAIASLMLYHGHNFERAFSLVEASALLCKGFAKDRRSLLLRFPAAGRPARN